jgi:recombination protein RecA
LWMRRAHARNPGGRIFLGIDSIAAMVPREAEEAGLEQNMRTRVSVASFLTWLLPRWQQQAANYNAMMFLVNQIRVAPGKYGNPEYTPGGNAIRFFCAIRLKMRRKGGPILKAGQSLGFKGVIQNWKNKAGEGSKEHAKTGFKLYYDGHSKYVPESEIKPTKMES